MSIVPSRNGRAKGRRDRPPAPVDEREQLVNGRLCGFVEGVAVPEAAVTSLHGILLDFDPDRLHPDLAPVSVLGDPEQLWERVVRRWLERHPALAGAEVRSSGRGVHAILRLSPAVAFETEAEREKWAAVVRVVQLLLPTDPDCPGITALARPVGSVNGKNNKTVTVLCEGKAVAPDAVLGLCEQAAARPFSTAVGLLFGEKRVSPCPVCRAEGSRMDVLDQTGVCYGRCGKVRLAQIRDRFLKPRPAAPGGA